MTNKITKKLLCEYGCGQIALYIINNEKGCCSSYHTKCPSVREKISKSSGRMGVEKKTTSKSEIKPSLNDIYWAAGFIEGDGYFSRPKRSECMEVTQKSVWPIQKLYDIFGGTLRLNKRGMYIWNVSGARARGMIFTLYLLMSPRRQKQMRKAMGI